MKPTALLSSMALAASILAGVAAGHEHGAHPTGASFGHPADAAKVREGPLAAFQPWQRHIQIQRTYGCWYKLSELWLTKR